MKPISFMFDHEKTQIYRKHWKVKMSPEIRYVMTRLLKDRLCIKMTFMHNGCWVDYYEKCSRHWHICLSINQTPLNFFNKCNQISNFTVHDMNFMCENAPDHHVGMVRRVGHGSFWDIEKIFMEFTFNFYPSNPKQMYPFNISIGNENCEASTLLPC